MSTEFEQAAVMWWHKVQGAPIDAPCQRELDAWLAESDAHRLAYLDVLMAMNAAGAMTEPLPASPSIADFEAVQGAAHRPGFGFGWRAGFAAVSLLTLAVIAVPFLPRLESRMLADEVSAVGQYRDLRLADGSLLRLGPDSAVRVQIDAQAREIELLRGELRLTVADDTRPLSVRHGDYRVRDIGTTFDVDESGQSLRVGVSEGEVEVSRHGRVLSNLQAGQQVDLHDGGTDAFVSTASVAPSDDLLLLDRASADQALARFERMSGVRVLNSAAPDSTQRLSAALPMSNAAERDAALATLLRHYGLQLSARGPGVIWVTQAAR